MSAPMPVAGVQIDCRLGDKAANLRRIENGIRLAHQDGAKLISFPECALTGYCFETRAEGLTLAEPLPGPSSARIHELCRELGVWVIYGLLELDHNKLFNSTALVGPEGFIASYRKLHLPHLGIDRFVTPGDRPLALHNLAGFKVAMLICFDGSFPEAARVLGLLGADLIVLATNWPEGAECSAQHMPPMRSLESHVYFMAVNRVGTERGFTFIGQSQLTDPVGKALAQAPADREAIIYGVVDPAVARLKRVRIIPGVYELDRTASRRPKFYRSLVDPRFAPPG